MKNFKQIKDLILNTNIKDKKVRKEMEQFNSTNSNVTTEDGRELLFILQTERPDLYKKWQLEISSNLHVKLTAR